MMNPNLPSLEQIDERIKKHLPEYRWLLSSTINIVLENPKKLPYFANVFAKGAENCFALDGTMNGALFQAYALALDRYYEEQHGQTNR